MSETNKFYCQECGQTIWAEEDCPEGDEPTICEDCAREFARADYEIDRRREEPDDRLDFESYD